MKAEVVGTPSEADGVTVAIGIGDQGPTGIVRIEYPMRMVDPASVLLLQRLYGADRL